MDPTGFDSIFSIATIARERLVVGTSSHSLLKIFDLRMAGGRVYDYLDANPTSASRVRASKRAANFPKAPPGLWQPGCNVFLDNRSGRHNSFYKASRRKNSPVYALSSPAPWSPTIFAGLEGGLTQLDVVSTSDRHPDPTYSGQIEREWSGENHVSRTRNSTRDHVSLTMHEQTENFTTRLHYQERPGKYSAQQAHLDDRWRRISHLSR